MRIALVSEYYYPHLGGVTEHVHHLARWLAERGHGVRIITNHVDGAPRRPDHEEVAPRVEVRHLGRGLPIESNGSQARVTVGFGLEKKMAEALAGCDLVHVHSPLFPLLPYLALKAARRRDLPVVGTFHTHFSPSRALGAFGGFVQSYMGALDRAIAVSPSAARSVEKFLGQPCALIPNGVDCAVWSSAPPAFAHSPTIAFLGRLDPRNDVDILLQAFARVRRSLPAARLVIIGDGERLRAPENVHVAGALESVAARASWLRAAQVLAFTARIVSHPMALLEGLAAGLPAAAYDIEGVRELIVEGRHGYKVRPGRAGELAAAIVRLLDDEPQRAEMAQHARAQAARFDWRLVGAKIFEIYRAAAGAAVEKGAA